MRVRVEDEKNNSNIVEELKKTTEVNRNNIYRCLLWIYSVFVFTSYKWLPQDTV